MPDSVHSTPIGPVGDDEHSTSRAASEAALEQAALALLKENGALAGLNLREVADRAGVNRGLVYHYYGSRQDLLRSALKRDLGPRLAEISEGGALGFPKRVRQLLRTLTGHEDAIQLATLLLLDKGTPVTLMPLLEDWRNTIDRDQKKGHLKEGFDEEAMVILITCLAYGFVLFRGQLARETGTSRPDLDWRIDEALGLLLKALEPNRNDEHND
ncbi:MAG: TetR/AcrR family transcriptional regulator [Rhodospirillaceae bacterium]